MASPRSAFANPCFALPRHSIASLCLAQLLTAFANLCCANLCPAVPLPLLFLCTANLCSAFAHLCFALPLQVHRCKSMPIIAFALFPAAIPPEPYSFQPYTKDTIVISYALAWFYDCHAYVHTSSFHSQGSGMS